MAYIKTSCRIRDKIEIEKYYPAKYGAPGQPRGKKEKKTPEEMAKQNLWRRRRELRRIIELNFSPGDWYVVLTCEKNKRPSLEDAPNIIRQFRDRLQRAYKKKGWELKYVITCETGERGAVHWNVIVNNVHDGTDSTARMIRELWDRGRPNFKALDDTGDYGRLADYIVKETSKRIENEKTIEKLSYMRSRNLIKPEVEKKEIKARGWRMDPVPPKGWELVPDSLVNEVNKFTGLPYQKYTLRREGGRERAGSGHIHRDKHKGPGKRNRKNNVHHEDEEKERK